MKEEDRAENERETRKRKEDAERGVKEEDRTERERETEESKGDVEREVKGKVEQRAKERLQGR